MKRNYDIENGTIPKGLTVSSEFSFPIYSSDIELEIPGSTNSIVYDEGIPIVSIDLSELSLTIEGNWKNRRLLQNESTLFIRKYSNNIQFSYSRIDNSPLISTNTKIFLSKETNVKDLYDFIGASGAPYSDAKVILGSKMQNTLQLNELSRNLKTEKFLGFDNTYDVKVSWENIPEVNKNILRWRASPLNKRQTLLNFNILEQGAYDSSINVKIESIYGSGISVTPINSVTKVDVISSGIFTGTASIRSSSLYGSGASFIASMTGSYPTFTIDSVIIQNGGINYIVPPVVYVENDSSTVFKSYIGITSINVLSAGINYISSPVVTVSGSTGPNGSIADVEASVEVFNSGKVDFVKILDSGTGYSSREQLSFYGGGGTGANGYILTDNGQIYDVIITDSGYGYTSNPSVDIISSTGTGANLNPISSLYADWNYIDVDAKIAAYSITNLNKNVTYEWQLFSSTADKNKQFLNTPIQSFKFY